MKKYSCKSFLYMLSSLFLLSCQEKEVFPLAPLSPDYKLDVEKHGLALLTTDFESFEEFRHLVDLRYYKKGKKEIVRLSYSHNGHMINGELTSGYADTEIQKAQHENALKKISVFFAEMNLLRYGGDAKKIYNMVRRRPHVFGADDVAVFNLAEKMMEHIYQDEKATLPAKTLSEKGLINTFNHILGQTFFTSIYSEGISDFIADVHERGNLKAMTNGAFTEEELDDIEFGAVDNYVDIVNNEIGQELGKSLRKKYQMHKDMIWNEALLCNYLNDVQAHFTWCLHLNFEPFKVGDPEIGIYVKKLNRLTDDSQKLRWELF